MCYRAVFHDETVYRDPESFIPERFTEEGAPDSMDTTFGFGRRYAPIVELSISYFSHLLRLCVECVQAS